MINISFAKELFFLNIKKARFQGNSAGGAKIESVLKKSGVKIEIVFIGADMDSFGNTTGRIINRNGIDENVQDKAKRILARIYQISPKYIERTEEGLGFLKKIGISMGIVTHANAEWTWRKYNWLELNRFFHWDDIYIVDENGHKTIKSWQKAMEYFKVRPKNCLVVGDSPRSDINPVCELGVEYCFLVQNPFEIWSIHQQPVDELKTRGIKSVNDLRWLGKEVVHRVTSSQN